MANNEMNVLKVGNSEFEIADAKARQDVSDLKDDFTQLDEYATNLSGENTIDFDPSADLLRGHGLLSGYYVNGTGTINNNTNFSHVLVDLNGATKIRIDGILHIYDSTQFTALGVFFDQNMAYIPNSNINELAGGGLLTFPIEVIVPSGAKYVGINTDYQASSYESSMPTGVYCYPWESFNVRKNIKVLGGAIRNTGNGWGFISDSNHEPLSLSSVNVNSSGQIVLDYGFTATKVVSLIVCPDETFATKYTVGASVGLDKSIIDISRIPITYGGRVIITNNVGNISYSSFTSISIETDGEIRLYHPSISDIATSQKFNITATSNSARITIQLGSQGNDYVSIYLLNSSDQRITDFTGTFDFYVNRDVNASKVNANSISDASGNFWIYGVMEVS